MNQFSKATEIRQKLYSEYLAGIFIKQDWEIPRMSEFDKSRTRNYFKNKELHLQQIDEMENSCTFSGK